MSDTTTDRRHSRAPWTAVGVLLCTLTMYFVAYVSLGVQGYSVISGAGYQVRRYSPDWVGKCFIPAAWVEATLFQEVVHIQRSNTYGYFTDDYVTIGWHFRK